MLDRFGADFMGACDLAGRWDYDGGYYSGHVDRFTNCGGPGATVIHIAATPIDDPDSLLVFVSVTTRR